MTELFKTYHFPGLYACAAIILYNICCTNCSYYFEFINIIFNKIYLLDYGLYIIILNAVGLCLFLKNVSFAIHVGGSITYNH